MAEANVELSRLPSFSSRSCCCRRAAPCRLNSQFSQPQSLKPWPTQPNLPKFGHLPASFLLSRKALENRRSPLRRCHRTPSTPTAVATGKQGKESSLLYVPNHHDPHWANYHRISSVRPYSIQYNPFRFPKAGNL